MIARRALLALILSAPLAAAAFAAEPARPFDRAAFEAAVADGGPVLVHVDAPWCPICRMQRPILEKLRDQPRFREITAFEVDFDTDKASVRAVGARLQSTLIVYRGGREIARTVGDREEGWIEELLEKAIAK
ncbi:thioredoxin family protein [Hansschlegelia zhihuaiae]|uniref:Thioredoxin n=1 Tax=Hansschlegelia zhihuaiae TaxID=405005 RepID=A0A4Q0MF08_9HYPH|nr:thioredoxin family protein [Hansschlegelia zhihuaiae]RXF72047.1 thioredoxin [Hansschlegelia zhihuaiae]